MMVDWYIPVLAFVLDYILADPESWPHPVRLMGKAIWRTEPWFRRLFGPSPASGMAFAVFLIFCTWTLTAGLIAVVMKLSPLSPLTGAIVNIVLLYFCLSARGLERAAMEIYRLLKTGNLETARQRLCLIVGRDVTALDEDGIARAIVETVAENLVDGVISPLFFRVYRGRPPGHGLQDGKHLRLHGGVQRRTI